MAPIMRQRRAEENGRSGSNAPRPRPTQKEEMSRYSAVGGARGGARDRRGPLRMRAARRQRPWRGALAACLDPGRAPAGGNRRRLTAGLVLLLVVGLLLVGLLVVALLLVFRVAGLLVLL